MREKKSTKGKYRLGACVSKQVYEFYMVTLKERCCEEEGVKPSFAVMLTRFAHSGLDLCQSGIERYKKVDVKLDKNGRNGLTQAARYS